MPHKLQTWKLQAHADGSRPLTPVEVHTLVHETLERREAPGALVYSVGARTYRWCPNPIDNTYMTETEAGLVAEVYYVDRTTTWRWRVSTKAGGTVAAGSGHTPKSARSHAEHWLGSTSGATLSVFARRHAPVMLATAVVEDAE